MSFIFFLTLLTIIVKYPVVKFSKFLTHSKASFSLFCKLQKEPEMPVVE